jgi:hypothetical protein
MVPETSVSFSHPTRVIAREDFMKFSRRESFRSYTEVLPTFSYVFKFWPKISLSNYRVRWQSVMIQGSFDKDFGILDDWT